MLRGSGCRFGDWFPLTATLFVLFLLGFQTDSLFSPKKNPRHELHFWRKKKDQSLPTPDSPRLPSNSTLLLPSQLYSSLPACLPLSALFHGERNRGSAVPVRNYVPFGSALRVGQTEECRLRPDSRELLAQTSSRTCVVLPSRPCVRSHWDPIQLSRWDRGASSAPSNGHNANYKPTPLLKSPTSHLNVRMWDTMCGNDVRTIFNPLRAHLWSVA